MPYLGRQETLNLSPDTLTCVALVPGYWNEDSITGIQIRAISQGYLHYVLGVFLNFLERVIKVKIFRHLLNNIRNSGYPQLSRAWIRVSWVGLSKVR
jgi:hypothetical protein